MITSLQNPRVREVLKLRTGRQRKKRGLILIDGVRELTRALEGGVTPTETFVCEPVCKTPASQSLLSRLRQLDRPLTPVSPQVYARLAYGERTDGVLAVAEAPQRTLGSLELSGPTVVGVVEGLEKPGNLGAVLRTADGAGLSAVIAADPATDLFNPNVIRASLGTVFTMPVVAAGADETLRWLIANGFEIYAAFVDGDLDYDRAPYGERTAIILGSEAAGLSDLWRSNPVHRIRLPMRGHADSLNVSAAAAVLFYEVTRGLLSPKVISPESER